MRNLTLALALAVMTLPLAACSDDGDDQPSLDAATVDVQCLPYPTPTSCEAGEYLYYDLACSAASRLDGGPPCEQRGDLTCYTRCTSDAECTDPCRPKCIYLAQFDRGDYDCNGRPQRVCGAPSQQSRCNNF